jgi:hypothetical protein
VVVYGSQTALDTQKQTTETLKQNLADGKAIYVFADTDKLDPNSELGKAARRSETEGKGLGPDGKSDTVFTAVYKVEEKSDGKLGVGDSVATFWGGRPDISSTLTDQLKYAKFQKATPEGPKPDQPSPPAPAEDGAGRDRPPGKPEDTGSNENKDDKPGEQDKAERERQKEKEARFKQLIEGTQGKEGYSLEEYANGWGKFLDRQSFDGPMRDLVEQFGRQMITGEFDKERLTDLMNKLGQTDQATVDEALKGLNSAMAGRLKFEAQVTDGRVSEIKATELGTEEAVSLSANNKNQITVNSPGSTMSESQASIRLAKKAEPDACP